MFDNKIDLDDYHGVEELERLARDVQDELALMERESAGAKFSEAERNKFSGLELTRREIKKRIDELQTRHQVIRNNARHPDRVERPEDAYFQSRTTHETRDGAMRTIDRHVSANQLSRRGR
jgi:hypothetical protein